MTGAAAMLRPGDVVIDCGANEGDVTEVLSATGATVHCFEPDPYAYSLLERRFSAAPNSILHHTSRWARHQRGCGGCDRGRDDRSPAFLEGLIADHGDIAMLKMDIEGAELDILEEMDARDLFAPIRVKLVEIHERKFSDLRDRFRALKTRMAGRFSPSKVNLDWI
ncbi:FkbM family methyltransferase [Ruegeria sp. PrR005]|uniref:FkbM family methyltransferase n=1 Tax=Ruegeria sp. PrR005 TaxID=2706882 RepID=A0A6B2NZN6_9RHOB|nr:FkbM family methyltransferase [Ruegeria sp. PrR005]NDW47345.1 FkbM family methyltransferase [Ruegeria sp. PrR005]